MPASSLSFRFAALFFVIGALMGLDVSPSMAPVHSQTHLLGWVSLFLMGVFYEHRPFLNTSPEAFWQVIAYASGAAVLNGGVTGVLFGYQVELLAALGALVMLPSAVYFAWLVFHHCGSAHEKSGRIAAPGL